MSRSSQEKGCLKGEEFVSKLEEVTGINFDKEKAYKQNDITRSRTCNGNLKASRREMEGLKSSYVFSSLGVFDIIEYLECDPVEQF